MSSYTNELHINNQRTCRNDQWTTEDKLFSGFLKEILDYIKCAWSLENRYCSYIQKIFKYKFTENTSSYWFTANLFFFFFNLENEKESLKDRERGRGRIEQERWRQENEKFIRFMKITLSLQNIHNSIWW